ncbi:CypX Cytochrome P450 [Pyrenophora tritici-repentis]|nr:CypX Cytochrome P450 [Pyrenophora tritici-repentis]KAI1595265.1 CypX Cytochrome P450 [Pyrenophora tritici-repentis]
MLRFIVIVGLLLFALTAKKLVTWSNHIYTARSSGFVVRKSPVHLIDLWWLGLYPKLVPWLNYLSAAWTSGWLPLSKIFHLWHVGHEPFEQLGSDNIMLSSPNGNMLWSSDPETINQIANQAKNFRKPVEYFSFFDTYGPNMQTSLGDNWKAQRKMVAPAIGSHSNAAMWQSSLLQAERLTALMTADGPVISHMKDHMSEISLHCIAQCFFNKNLEYETIKEFPSRELPEGRFGFVEAMFTTIDKLGIIDSIPKSLRAYIPLKSIKRADKAYHDLHSYITEICDEALKKDATDRKDTDISIMDTLIASTRPESAERNGKVFFFLLSGHGTAGNTLGFMMFLLAIRQDIQADLHAHLDAELGGKPIDTWSVTDEFMRLYNGYTGAVLKEAMRLYNVVEFIPRRCTAEASVTDLNGNHFTIPRDTLCLLNFTAAFRHPSIWPAGPTANDPATGKYHPMLDFDPSRWDSFADKITKPSEVGLRTYFPFGLGGRACLGKSLGSIMMVGVLAYIFTHFSIELVPSHAVEEEATRTGADEKWVKERTQEQALQMLVDEVECNLLIELRKELPVRLVPRLVPQLVPQKV